MLIEIFALSLIFLVYFAAKDFLKTDLSGEAVLGIIIGFCWEMLTEPLFIYHGPMIFIYGDVPLGIILFWGLVLMIASPVSDKISSYFKLDGLKRIFAHMAAILVVVIPYEYTGAFILNLWDYASPSTFTLVFFGWLFFGTLMLVFIKKYSGEVERYWLK